MSVQRRRDEIQCIPFGREKKPSRREKWQSVTYCQPGDEKAGGGRNSRSSKASMSS
jgi:hypothetical protein